MPKSHAMFCIVTLILSKLLTACQTVSTPPAPAVSLPQPDLPAAVAIPAPSQPRDPAEEAIRAGEALFVQHCASCHKAKHMPARRASRIRSASRQFPIMYHTRSLKDGELQQIAAFLASQAISNPPKFGADTKSKGSTRR